MLGTDGNSGDESDHRLGELRYVILSLPWRSHALTEYLRTLDLIHLSTRYTRRGKPKKGAFPRLRIVKNGLSDRDSEPVPGLPRNFYDTKWLKGLPQLAREELRVRNINVDLSIPPEIMA